MTAATRTSHGQDRSRAAGRVAAAAFSRFRGRPFKAGKSDRSLRLEHRAHAPVWVTLVDGEEMVNLDGVTRAVRVAKLAPEATIPVEIVDEYPQKVVGHLSRVKERL